MNGFVFTNETFIKQPIEYIKNITINSHKKPNKLVQIEYITNTLPDTEFIIEIKLK